MGKSNGLFLQNFFLLRLPTYPVEYIIELNQHLSDLYFPEKQHTALRKIKEKFEEPLFVESIFYASKNLYHLLIYWLSNPTFQNKDSQKLLLSLQRYYSRMCTRCTPFGVFAGCAVGFIANQESAFHFDFNNRISRHVRLDYGMLSKVSNHMTKQNELCQFLKFRLNDMHHCRQGKVFFMESSWNGKSNTYSISAITKTKYLNHIIDTAGTGFFIQDMVERLKQFDNSISKDRYEYYINDLISCQFLISELIPNVTGENYLNRIKKILRTHLPNNDLNLIFSSLDKIISRPNYKQYYNDAEALVVPLQKIAGTKDTLQTDVNYILQSNVLNTDFMEEIVNTSEELWMLNNIGSSRDLNEFTRRFKMRYEGQIIPLLTVLDPDSGIGYGNAINGNTEYMPLLKDVAFRTIEESYIKNNSKFQSLVTRIYEDFLVNKTQVYELNELELLELSKDCAKKETKSIQNQSAFIFGTILSASTEEFDNGNYQFVASQLHNYSAGRMLGRFASGNPTLFSLLSDNIKNEDDLNNGIIVAEVVHAPTGHALNVVARPKFREFEIPILCQPSVQEDGIIPLQDLLVSFRDNRIVLTSKKHGMEVLPRITNSFNSQRGEPIYRFMADLASQHTRPFFQWDWMDFADRIYLPRIKYKKFIISRARWRIPQIKPENLHSPELLEKQIKKIKDKYKIPRFVVLIQDSDNELLIDMENSFCLNQLSRVLKKRNVILLEFLGLPNECFISSDNKHFCNQVVIPLRTNKRAYSSILNYNDIQHDKIKREYSPGSEWLYFKIYGGNKTLDNLIVDIISPIIEDLKSKFIIEKWFFIRYNDPNSHIRLRFMCNVENFQYITTLLHAQLQLMIENKDIDKLQIDTYKRELERYGTKYIEDSETLFCNDSEAVVNILNYIDGDDGENVRWWAALKSVDSLLDDFHFTIQEKQILYSSLFNMFFDEFATKDADNNKKFRISLNDKYRADYNVISSAINDPYLMDSILLLSYSKRSQANSSAISNILSNIEKHGEYKFLFESFIKSHIHMCLNRLFVSNPRKHELVIYHYLNEYYKSQIAIQKQKKKLNYDV